MKYISVRILFICILLAMVPTQISCKRDCDGTAPTVRVTNYCQFDMWVETDIIGGTKHHTVLSYLQSVSYAAHETKVSVKAKKNGPLIALSRTKNINTKNCKMHDIEINPQDSGIIYEFILHHNSSWK